ncbi:hypothetical protein Ddc_23176 [Ditylenchus destructor]|nr:hypothetical protein Ddc_23176 [Ditylenchus destructor]
MDNDGTARMDDEVPQNSETAGSSLAQKAALNAQRVHRDGHVYHFDANLKSHPPWKHRMRCTRNGKQLPCNGAIWTTGEWETDSRGRFYQRGILRGGHSHDAYEHFLNEDDTAFVGSGGPVDDKSNPGKYYYVQLNPNKCLNLRQVPLHRLPVSLAGKWKWSLKGTPRSILTS